VALFPDTVYVLILIYRIVQMLHNAVEKADCHPNNIFIHSVITVRMGYYLRKNFRTDLHDIFREDWQWANEQMIKFWWRAASPSGYKDCFPDSSREIYKSAKPQIFPHYDSAKKATT